MNIGKQNEETKLLLLKCFIEKKKPLDNFQKGHVLMISIYGNI